MAATVMAVLSSSLIISNDPPKITIDGWRNNVDFGHWNTSSTPPLSEASTSSVFIVPNVVGGMALLCNASYPIEWAFHRERWGGRSNFQISITHMRGSDPETLSPLWYSSELRFAGGNKEITGNYTCQRFGQPDMSTSVYIFWEGSSPPYLTLPQRSKDPRKVEFNPKMSQSFTLPCTISRPDIAVNLFKLTNNISVPLVPNPQNRSVRFDPQRGYVLKNLPDPYGSYECVVGDREDEDVLSFEVLEQTELNTQPEFENIKWKNASFEFDSKTLSFKCCSSSAKPPKMAYQLCNHPTLCKLKKHVLHRMEWNGRRSQRVVNGSCSYLSIPLFRGRIGVIGGVVRCVGDSVDLLKEYFLPTLKNQVFEKNASVVPYFNWNEADPQKMMTLTEFTKPVYYGETKTIMCAVSPYYFSQGLHWAIQYENTTTKLRANQTRIGRRHAFSFLEEGNDSLMKVFIEKGLKSVTCFAPVWNSLKWAEKTVTIKPVEPMKPKLKGPEVETFYWNENNANKTLTCEFEGTPKPGVYWKKNKKNIFMGISSTYNSTTLTVPVVSFLTDATYTCNISNVGGSSIKTFVVVVPRGVNMLVVGAYVFAGVCLVGVLVGGYFAWNKMKTQKEAMRRLANVAFKDVTDSHHSPQPIVPHHTGHNGTSSPPIAIVPTSMVAHADHGFFGDSQTAGFFQDTGNGNGTATAPALNDFGKYQKM